MRMSTLLKRLKHMERAAGFEPATTCLGSKDSTTELRPLTEVYRALTTSTPITTDSGVITVLILNEKLSSRVLQVFRLNCVIPSMHPV